MHQRNSNTQGRSYNQNQRSDDRVRSESFNDITVIMNAALQPVLEHINKIELMSREQVTRADLIALQTRLETALERVSKDTYPREILDQRRAAYDERLINLTTIVNGNRADMAESIKRLETAIDKQDSDTISTQERGFLRVGFVISSAIGIGGLLITVINFAAQHFH